MIPCYEPRFRRVLPQRHFRNRLTEISRLFEHSYREYGSAWKDDTHGGVLKNLLRALTSMRKVKEMIVVHEQSMNFTYDVVIGSRLDVFWTHAVPAEGYQNRNHSFCTTRLYLHLRFITP